MNWARVRLQSYVADIGLDAEQARKVDALLPSEAPPDPVEREAQRLADLLAAFVEDGFDANRFPFGESDDGRAPFFRLARFVAKVVPLLRPDQRAKLADKLVEPPPPRRPPRRAGAATGDER